MVRPNFSLAAFTLAFSSLLLSCADGASAGSPEHPEIEGDGGGEELADTDGGQSGNEGTSLRYPCFYQEQTVLTVRVTSAEGGCFAGEILSLESTGADASGLSVGGTVSGILSLFYTETSPTAGDSVAVQYFAGPSETDGSVQVTPLVDGKVRIDWLGASYDYSLSELFGESCEAMIAELPNQLVEAESDEDDAGEAAPPEQPLSCPAP
jgi:hypothetical protein